MSTKQQDKQDKQDADDKKQERQQRSVEIGKHVMDTLGQPGDLHRVQVRRLWEDRYRVNIFVGVDVAAAKVANSFFLVTDGAGNIVASTPAIKKQY